MVMLWGLLMGAALLVAGGWFMHRYGEEGSAGEVLGLPSRLILTAVGLGLTVFVFRTMGPVFALFLVLVIGLLLGILWVPTLVSLVLNPLSGSLTGGSEPIEAKPYYSRAQGLRKRGEFTAAQAAVKAEFAKFPGDAAGLLLLAQILAEDLHNSEGAAAVLQELADTPGRPGDESCLALNHLADLQLKHWRDPAAAKQTWERIVAEFPNTTASHLAQQRLAHLGGGRTSGVESEAPKLVVKVHSGRMGLTEDLGASQLPVEDATQKVAELVAHLEQHPQDWDAREQLARLYLDPLGRMDLATDQLERLLSETNVPTRHVVRWYNELADLQLKSVDGVAVARLTLERLVSRLPDTPFATQAEARLRHLVWDQKGKQTTRTIKLGQHQSNLGLRRGDASIPDPDPESAERRTQGE